jgi:hypothetical protein
MRQKHKTYTPVVANATEFASAMTGAIWTLENTKTSDEMAHSLLLTNNSAVDHSSKTFTIVYFDENNRKVTETKNMPGASLTVAITNPGHKIQSITPSETIGTDTMKLGTVAGVIYALPIPLNHRAESTGIATSVTGTVNYTLQNTFSEIQNKDAVINWKDHDDSSFVAVAVGGNTNFAFNPLAMRVVFNTFTAGAKVYLDLAPYNAN